MRSVNDGEHKLIVYPPINRRQLFAIRTDPHEMVDLAGNPGQIDTLARMEGLMRAEQKAYGDKQPLRVEKPKSGKIRFDDFTRKTDDWQPAWIVDKYFQKP